MRFWSYRCIRNNEKWRLEYIDVKKASEQWNISQRRITTLCRDGRIDGAKKEKGVWMIPYNASKLFDGRKRDTCKDAFNRKLSLPIGISDFKKLVKDYYYIEKTLFIKDFLDNRPQVSLYTRPRRFGVVVRSIGNIKGYI